jgi:flavin-dependent dehydrogenase
MDDVIVVGAGPAGALAAAILARAGVRVQLFDRARFPRAKLCGDTLNPGALRVLAAHMPLDTVFTQSLPIAGMLLTGPGRVSVRGVYGGGVQGRAITRRALDVLLVQQATAAGAQFDDNTSIAAPVTAANGAVAGVVIRAADGRRFERRARLVIAADGRESRLARAAGLSKHPLRPRRWAIGGYFEDAERTATIGEMHVRRGHYIGVAPVPGELTNACLVVPYHAGDRGWADPGTALTRAIAADAALAPRFARARLVEPPHVLGPMAVDTSAAGRPGLLLAGDAAGFIDPITGDGLRFALMGAALAAGAALDVLSGRLDHGAAVAQLAAQRRRAFAAKWRFNRALRGLVASAHAVTAAAAAACVIPSAFEAIIRYAGDCDTEPNVTRDSEPHA